MPNWRSPKDEDYKLPSYKEGLEITQIKRKKTFSDYVPSLNISNNIIIVSLLIINLFTITMIYRQNTQIERNAINIKLICKQIKIKGCLFNSVKKENNQKSK